jgi:hypothetical protein
MDALDNVIFATLQSPLQTGAFINSDYIPGAFGPFVPGNTTPVGIVTPVFNFSVANKELYSSYNDPSIFEPSITRHWYDINGNGIAGSPAANFQYDWAGIGVVSDFTNSSTYHFLYSYLIENSRILQIFERVIEKYLHDEDLGIAPQAVYQWFLNAENLFFKDGFRRSQNIRSLIRSSFDYNRRNAYYRMFGIDLAFGDINSGTGGTVPYIRAKTANQQFIPLFERYLTEIWQGFINARNTSGANSSDVNQLVELAIQIQELLGARRGGRPGGAVNAYAGTNLSQEEFSSAMLITWFTFIISANTNVVQFLNCQSSTIGERLIKIGEKVGVPAHSKCQALFEMAGAAGNILTLLEAGGYLDANGNVQNMLTSLIPGTAPSIDSDYMNAFLLVINNWEKATGHRIKNAEVNVRGMVSIAGQQQRQSQPQPQPQPQPQSQPRSNGKPAVVPVN